VVDQILTPLFVSLDRLGDGRLAKRTKSVCVAHAGAAALAALLSRVRAEGNGGVRLFSGGAERLEADVELIIVAVEAFLFSATFSATKKEKEKEKQKEKETSLSLTRLFRAAAKRGRAVVAIAKAAGTAASSAKGQAYAAARAALGAEEAETWRKVCVK
jgi:TctA family transporter